MSPPSKEFYDQNGLVMEEVLLDLGKHLDNIGLKAAIQRVLG